MRGLREGAKGQGQEANMIKHQVVEGSFQHGVGLFALAGLHMVQWIN